MCDLPLELIQYAHYSLNKQHEQTDTAKTLHNRHITFPG